MDALYYQVADRIEKLIRDKIFIEGDRLPGVRVLSKQLNVSISTLLQAFQILEARGFIEAKSRSGHYVKATDCDHLASLKVEDFLRPTPITPRDIVMEMCAEPQVPLIPLASAIPHPSFLPLRQLQNAFIRAARKTPKSVGYAFPGKHEYLRQVAQRMSLIDAAVPPQEIIATNGAYEAIIIALRAITNPGDVIAIESPSFPGVLQAIQTMNLKVIEIPAHPIHGIRLEVLATALSTWPIKACIVVTNHSNPMGMCLSEKNKIKLVKMLADYSVPLIEDDIYGDLFHSGARPRPAKSFDTHGNVIYCSSFSKTISPELRLGWIVPGKHHQSILQQKYFNNLGTSTLPQMAVAYFLEQGGYERYLRKARTVYRDSVEKMRDSINRYFPSGTVISRPEGGFVVWVQLPQRASATTLFRRGRAHGIDIAPGSMFTTSGRFDDCLRLSAANPWSDKVEQAVRVLGSLAADLNPN